eukprot:2785665-Rhodomonas_salina.7
MLLLICYAKSGTDVRVSWYQEEQEAVMLAVAESVIAKLEVLPPCCIFLRVCYAVSGTVLRTYYAVSGIVLRMCYAPRPVL